MKAYRISALLLIAVALAMTAWWWRDRREDAWPGLGDGTRTRYVIPGRGSAAAERAGTAAGEELQAAPTGSLEVRLYGVRAGQGTIRIAIFREERGFPADGGMRVSVASDAPVTIATVDRLVPGPCAVAAFHDLDNDGLLDKGSWGIPTEPYGFSNDARGTWGPPPFAEAAFSVGKGPVVVTIELK